MEGCSQRPSILQKADSEYVFESMARGLECWQVPSHIHTFSPSAVLFSCSKLPSDARGSGSLKKKKKTTYLSLCKPITACEMPSVVPLSILCFEEWLPFSVLIM